MAAGNGAWAISVTGIAPFTFAIFGFEHETAQAKTTAAKDGKTDAAGKAAVGTGSVATGGKGQQQQGGARRGEGGTTETGTTQGTATVTATAAKSPFEIKVPTNAEHLLDDRELGADITRKDASKQVRVYPEGLRQPSTARALPRR